MMNCLDSTSANCVSLCITELWKSINKILAIVEFHWSSVKPNTPSSK